MGAAGLIGSIGATTIQEVQLIVILLAVTLVVALVSRRLRLPYTLVLVIAGLVIGVLPILQEVHLEPDTVLFLFLPALLFEGAWNVEVEKLAADWLPILLLAVPGLLIAVALVAIVLHFGINLSWLLAVLLGAIVSPTDPVAAIALLRQLGLSERLRSVIEGESLFNDGVGAALFEIVLALLLPSLGMVSVAGAFKGVSFLALEGQLLWLFLGGPLLGLLIGWIVARLLRFVDDYLVEITITFGVAYAAYLLGVELRTSGLLAVVGAGLVIGSYGRSKGMSRRTQEAAQNVWEFIAYVANSLLFLLLGIQIGASHFLDALPGIFWAFLGVIVGRVLIVYTLIPLHDILARHLEKRPGQQRLWRFFPRPRPLARTWRPLLVLTGLRGALSMALVLSLPRNFTQRELLASIVYGVVLITLLGQGLTLRFLLPRWPTAQKDSAYVSPPHPD